MSSAQVRPFRRDDRDQLTRLVNAHVEAVVPASNPYWPDATGAAEALMTACTIQFGAWGVTRQHAGGDLPVPGVYGVPEQWPHVAALYQRAGFTHTGHTEIVYLALVQDLPAPSGPPLEGLTASGPGCSGRPPTGCAWPRSAGCSTMRG